MTDEQPDNPFAPLVSNVVVNRLDLDPSFAEDKKLTPQQLENYYNHRYQSLITSDDTNIKSSRDLGLIGIEFNSARSRNDTVAAQQALARARAIMEQQGLSVSDVSKGLNEFGTNAGKAGEAILGGGLALISAIAGSGARPAPTELVDKVSTTIPKLMARYREAAASGNLASAFDIRSSIEAVIAKNRSDFKSILPVLNASGGEEQQQMAQLIDGLVNNPDSIFLNVDTLDKDGKPVNLGGYLQTLPEDQRKAISDSVKSNIARRLGSSIVGTTAKWAEAAYDLNHPLHSIISPLYNTILAKQETTGTKDPDAASKARIAKNRLQAITSFYDTATKNGVFQNDEEAAAFIDGMQGVLWATTDPGAPVLPISEAELTKAGNLFKQMRDSGENISAKDFATTMQSLQRAMTSQVVGPDGSKKSVQNYAFDSKALMNLALSTQLMAREQGLAIPGIGSKEFGDLVVNAYKRLDQFHTEYGISLFGDKSDPNRSRTLADLVLQMNGMPGSGATNRLNNMVDVTRKIDSMVNKSGLVETTKPGPDGKPVKMNVRAPSELPEFERVMKQELGRFITSEGDPWTAGSGVFNKIRISEETRNRLIDSVTNGLVSAGLVLDSQKTAASKAVGVWLDSNLAPVGRRPGTRSDMSIYDAFRECAVLKTPPELAVIRARIDTTKSDQDLTAYTGELERQIPQTQEEKELNIIARVAQANTSDSNTLDAIAAISKLHGDDITKWTVGNDTNIITFIRNLRYGKNRMSTDEVIDVCADIQSWYVDGTMPSEVANQLANAAFINLNANLDKMGMKRRGQIIKALKSLGFGDGTTSGWNRFIAGCEKEVKEGRGQLKDTKDAWLFDSGVLAYDEATGMVDINMNKYIPYMIDKNIRNPDVNWGNTGDAVTDGSRQILGTYATSDGVKSRLFNRIREKLSADGLEGNEATVMLSSLASRLSELMHSSGGMNAAESFVESFVTKTPYYFPNPADAEHRISSPVYLTEAEARAQLETRKKEYERSMAANGKTVDISRLLPPWEQFLANQRNYRMQHRMMLDSRMKSEATRAGIEYAKSVSPDKDDD